MGQRIIWNEKKICQALPGEHNPITRAPACHDGDFKSKTYDNYSAYRADPGRDRFSPGVALQSWLGLCTERWHRNAAFDSADSLFARRVPVVAPSGRRKRL
jgi:hypothetical protein